MVSRTALSEKERELRSQLHSLLNHAEDFIHGTAVEVARRCGNPNCKCATNDEDRHKSVCLGQTKKGASSTLHIPRQLESKVRDGIDNYTKAMELFEALNVEARIRLDKAKASRRKSTKKSVAKRKSTKKKTPSKPS